MADSFVDLLFEGDAVESGSEESLTSEGGGTALLFGAIVMPAFDIPVAQAFASNAGQVYLVFSITDPAEGALTFYWGQAPFTADTFWTGPPVYPCILSWGEITKYLTEGGVPRESMAVLALDPTAYVCPANVPNKRFRVSDVLRLMDMRETSVSIYQWNPASVFQDLIWKGYWGGMRRWRTQGGTSAIDVLLRGNPKDASDKLSSVVTRDDATYANAPDEAIGLMLPRAYGRLDSSIDSVHTVSNAILPPQLLGYGMRGVRMVPTDQNVSYVEPHTRMVATQNDGVSGWSDFPFGTISLGSVGGIWVWLPEVGAYAHVESSDSISATNNNGTDSHIDVKNAPVMWVVLRPTLAVGASPGFTDLGNAVDDDASNFVEVPDTGTDFTFGYICPSISLAGATIEEVRVAVDFSRHNGAVTFRAGLYSNAGSTWWGGATKYDTISSASIFMLDGDRAQIVTDGDGIYTSAVSAAFTGTQSEFGNGRFVTKDGSGNQQPLVMRVWLVGGTNLYVHSMALLVRLSLPKEQVGLKTVAAPEDNPFFPFFDLGMTYTRTVPRMAGPKEFPGLEMIATGKAQKDDGSGTYTGTAAAVITKAPDIARHIIKAIGGAVTNDTPGTLGNFIDARTDGTAGEQTLGAVFGPDDPKSWRQTVFSIGAGWPAGIYEEDNVWVYVKREMNPHSSRIYRSASEPIRISFAKNVVGGRLEFSEQDSREIVNNVVVNYGQSYGNNGSMGSYAYQHPFSVDRFGLSDKRTINAPWITRTDLVSDHPEAAKYLARYHATVSARPRLRDGIVWLTQEFYDLKPGHVFEFDEDVELCGVSAPIWRCGLLDYLYPSSVATVNQADNILPDLLTAGGVAREMYGMSCGQQTGSVTLDITGAAAAFTKITNAWQYYNGTSWVNLANTRVSDGTDPDDVLSRMAIVTVSWDRPLITDWKKATYTIGAATIGPGYLWRFRANNVTVPAYGNAIVKTPAKIAGRLFEVMEVSRRADAGGYPYVEAVFQEVM